MVFHGAVWNYFNIHGESGACFVTYGTRLNIVKQYCKLREKHRESLGLSKPKDKKWHCGPLTTPI